MCAPVVLFVYNRPEHTRAILQSLNNNKLVEETELFIFSDGPKSVKDENAITLVRKVILEFIKDNQLKKVTLQNHECNKGLAQSVIEGVNQIINRYGSVIVIEDDLILSSDFLTYMNQALKFYRKDQNIWSISGYSFPMKNLIFYRYDVYLSYRGCSWGWATWKDRWEAVDWRMTDYEEFIVNKKLQKKFNRGGRDLTGMIKSQMERKIDSWAIRWCYSQYKQEKYTVYPKISRVINGGCDGSGTHSGVNNEFGTFLAENPKECNFIHMNHPSNVIMFFYKRKYDYTLWKKIKKRMRKYFQLLN